MCAKGATPRGPRPPHYRGCSTITLRHTTLGRTTLDEWSAQRRNLYLTTHNTQQEKQFHAPSNREDVDPHLRPHCDWCRHHMTCTQNLPKHSLLRKCHTVSQYKVNVFADTTVRKLQHALPHFSWNLQMHDSSTCWSLITNFTHMVLCMYKVEIGLYLRLK
jgi:hypothetical protein